MKKRIVVALGGNALGNSAKEQREAVKATALPIVDLIEAGHEVVLAHGNGPQVGMINLAMDSATKNLPSFAEMPITECVAMSQGYIGYHLQRFIRDELKDFKFQRPEATYLAWIDARDVPFTSDEIQDALVNVGGVAIMKGEIYGENGAKYLRMNLGCPRSKIEEGLKRFKKAMDYLYNK